MLFISTLRIIPITIHSLGLVCLYKQKQRKHIQKTLLMNLSFIEILLVTAGFFVSVVEVFQWISNVIYNRIVVSVYVISNLMFYIIMFIITIDRLLCVVLHVRYSYYITPLRVKKFLLGTWACAFVGFLTLCIADVSKIYRYAIYLYLTLDIYTGFFREFKHFKNKYPRIQCLFFYICSWTYMTYTMQSWKSAHLRVNLSFHDTFFNTQLWKFYIIYWHH